MKGAVMATVKEEIEAMMRWHAMTDAEVSALRDVYLSKVRTLEGILKGREKG
tara:strand:- start:3815 stop:3970 length:156 start_codon:yes stop_codon:yes gene_type:complete